MITRFHSWRSLLLIALGTTLIAGALSPLSPSSAVLADGDPVLVGAGDIGGCGAPSNAKTAKLLDSIPGMVFAAGDLAAGDGGIEEYQKCFALTWGRFKGRMQTIPGNHDYHQGDIKPYLQYLGPAAGTNPKGYYAFNLGAWHIVMLNSNAVVGLQEEELAWLKTDLAANRGRCILAMTHHPVFSSGIAGVTAYSRAYFSALYEVGASVLISGDEHDYERFTPQNLRGEKEPGRGIRQFVVGTGGSVLTGFGPLWRNTEARDNTTHGVLKLTLHPGGYSWEFIPVADGAFTDSGSAACSSLPSATPAATAHK